MAAEFIFMLTRADRTVPDAEERLEEVLAAGIRHIGFKDIGVEISVLRRLTRKARAAGATLYLEMVCLDAATEKTSAEVALALEVDVLMGGTRPDVVTPVIATTPIRYYPFPGEIVGHPSRLCGSIESIAFSAKALVKHDRVHGLDLLAYRFDGQVPDLIRRVCEIAGGKPVIIAGSIDRPERILEVLNSGASGFTVGTAAFESAFPVSRSLGDQIAFISAQIQNRKRPRGV